MTPTSIPCFISLNTATALEKEPLRAWMECLRAIIPSGILTTVRVANGTHAPMVYRASKTMHRFIVPLTRHLLEDEVEPVVKALGDIFDFDFDVMVTKCETEANLPTETIRVEHERYDAICRAFAKRQHEQWMTDRLNAGWRYAVTMSMADKTSPMLRPWDELPEALRTVDYKQPQAMVDLLNDQGYVVISKEELAGIYKLIRNTL